MKKLQTTLSLCAFVLLTWGCSGKEQPGRGHDSHQNHSGHAEMHMEAGEPSTHSIYNVSSTWQNRHGKTVRLDDLRGKTQVVAMLYTHCEYACPRIIADMRRIRDELSEEALRSTNFTIVSIDPERDTPEQLRAFASENDLSEEHWTLLHGSSGEILELAALLGIKYKRISDSDFAHSNTLTVLNAQGEIAHQQKKLGDQLTHTIQTIEKLAE